MARGSGPGVCLTLLPACGSNSYRDWDYRDPSVCWALPGISKGMISAELHNHLELWANLTSTSQDFQISSTLITLSSLPSKKELGAGPEEQYRAESCERGVTQTLDPGI